MKGLADNPSYIIELMEDGVTLEDVVDGHIYEQALVSSSAEKNAFVVADLGSLMRQHVCWQTIVPHLQPYFPVKSNSNPLVIEVLASLGLGFVCANKVESAIRPLLDAYFPPLSGVQVLAEPGGFYVASAFSLAVNIIGKKLATCPWDDGNNDNTEFLYYMNEGVYGPFSQKLLGNTIAAPSVHKVSRPFIQVCCY
uniref:Antizyme inhibitor 1b n=1 Tax=Neogobius melanostomus TaxID=47308 RepID=A0A8C6TNK9_9GOBI